MQVNTGGPRYMRFFLSAILRICDRELSIFWNLSSNLQSSLVILYANPLYASIFFWSLSLPYNEGNVYLLWKTISFMFHQKPIKGRTILLRSGVRSNFATNWHPNIRTYLRLFVPGAFLLVLRCVLKEVYIYFLIYANELC